MNKLFLLVSLLFSVALASVQQASTIVPAASSSSSQNECLSPLVSSSSSNIRTSKILKIRGGSGSSDIDWRFFLAGGLCAATSHGITTPIDVVKTRMQQSPEKYTKGVIQATRDIVAAEGPAFLLSGLAPTVVGYGLEGALKFGFYETFKKVFAHTTKSKTINFLLASVIAGGIASVVLCPMEEARIKMVGDKTWSRENLISAMFRLGREGGLLSTFTGLPAMLSKQVPYTMSKQVSFDLIAEFLKKFTATWAMSKSDLQWFVSIASAFIASIFACLGSQPGDTILTATYNGTNTSIFAIMSDIYRKHGIGGFFLGLQARLVHVASIITSQLVLYDILKTALGLPVTGSH